MSKATHNSAATYVNSAFERKQTYRKLTGQSPSISLSRMYSSGCNNHQQQTNDDLRHTLTLGPNDSVSQVKQQTHTVRLKNCQQCSSRINLEHTTINLSIFQCSCALVPLGVGPRCNSSATTTQEKDAELRPPSKFVRVSDLRTSGSLTAIKKHSGTAASTCLGWCACDCGCLNLVEQRNQGNSEAEPEPEPESEPGRGTVHTDSGPQHMCPSTESEHRIRTEDSAELHSQPSDSGDNFRCQPCDDILLSKEDMHEHEHWSINNSELDQIKFDSTSRVRRYGASESSPTEMCVPLQPSRTNQRREQSIAKEHFRSSTMKHYPVTPIASPIPLGIRKDRSSSARKVSSVIGTSRTKLEITKNGTLQWRRPKNIGSEAIKSEGSKISKWLEFYTS